MKRKTVQFSFGILFLIGISIFILSCEKKDPPVPEPQASSIQSTSGNSQSAELGQALTNPIEVVVKDQDGEVFSGAAVSFSVTEGSVSPTTAKTDASGKAKTSWTLGPTEGTQTLTVTAFKADGKTKLSGSPITFTATATEKKASSIELVSGENQTAKGGTVLTNLIKILVKDQNGDAFAGAAVNFEVLEGSVSSASEITDANGNASVSWTLGSTAGTQALTVTAFKADGTTALSGSPITVNATASEEEAASIELVSGGDQTANVGTVLTNLIKILVKDQNGDAFAGAAVNFEVSEGSVSSASEISNTNGNVFVLWTLGSTAGAQALTVTAFKADGTTALLGSPIIVNATATVKEAASIELVSGQDQIANVGTVLINPIIILVKDQNGDAFAGAAVNFEVSEGSVSSASEITDANGNASVSWTLGSSAGTQALTVTAFKADGTTALTGSPITVNATVKDAASIELLSGGDQTGLTEVKLYRYIYVKVRDANGNPYPDAPVHYSLTEGSVPHDYRESGHDGEVGTTWTLGPTEGIQTLTITAFKADGITHLTGSPLIVYATATGAVPEYIKVDNTGYNGGEDQTGKVNTPLLYPVDILVAGGGLVFEGETVYFEVSEGSVSQTTAITDADGLTSVSWTLGPTIGTQTLTVTCYKPDGITHLINSPLLVYATAEAENETGTVSDYDANVYQTVKIGEQWWMAENLKVTHLPDGTAITKVTDDTDWKNLGLADKAYCFENNDDNSDYGVFYTRSAATNGDGSSTTNPSGIQGVCPDGWHIPSDAEWFVLKTGRTPGVLKEPGTEHWLPPGIYYESNNETGFTALGAGLRSGYDGTFKEVKESANWWSTDTGTYGGIVKSFSFYISYYSVGSIGKDYDTNFDYGLSVRCVKD